MLLIYSESSYFSPHDIFFLTSKKKKGSISYCLCLSSHPISLNLSHKITLEIKSRMVISITWTIWFWFMKKTKITKSKWRTCLKNAKSWKRQVRNYITLTATIPRCCSAATFFFSSLVMKCSKLWNLHQNVVLRNITLHLLLWWYLMIPILMDAINATVYKNEVNKLCLISNCCGGCRTTHNG